jgi:hypothetical protein
MSKTFERFALLGAMALASGSWACSSSTDGGGNSDGSGGSHASSGGTTGGNTGGSTGGGTGGATGGSSGSTGGSTGGGTGGATGGSSGSTGGSGGGDMGGAGGGAGGSTGGVDAGGAGAPGGNDITGKFSDTQPVQPIMAGYWVGKPANPQESGGGPFVYLFSGAVKCADISKGNGWIPMLPAGSQGMEMIIGTTKEGTSVPIGAAGAGKAEVNYILLGPGGSEHNSKSGMVTVTAYKAGMYVEGTLDVVFPFGMAKGKFHAEWCPTGYEL